MVQAGGILLPQWCEGPTGSGKTAWLLQHLLDWLAQTGPESLAPGQSLLVFAANGDNRLVLNDRLTPLAPGRVTVLTTTPTAFMQAEVILFWPLLLPQLGPLPQFPLRLRPENEQELASRFWQGTWAQGLPVVEGWLPEQTVRRSLDFLQMAAAAGIPAEDLPTLLSEGIPAGFAPAATWRAIGDALVAWRDWCLSQSLLTYGVMTELYWRHLLPQPTYQRQLLDRYAGLWLDDLDEYPAVTAQWLQVFIDRQRPVALTWNPYGKVRLGLGADPDRLESLKPQCQVVDLTGSSTHSLADHWLEPILEGVFNPLARAASFPCCQSLQTTSRGELLRQMAETIITAVQSGAVAATEVAIIGPGLDAIARYTLIEILSRQGLPVASLNDQRPLIHSPLVRSLLTLLAFIYPGLGHLLEPAAVAEMLMVLSYSPQSPEGSWVEGLQIDPVRAELLVDHCFAPHLEQPELLPVERFDRWDRLGYKATHSYNQLGQWIDQQRQQRQQRLVPGVVAMLDRAIQNFYGGGYQLPADQLSALRELMETAQHYWRVEERQHPIPAQPPAALERFIQLLRQGTVTANPFPAQSLPGNRRGVTIATVFQYRQQRLRHRWQFWLDAGSARWLTGTDNLFGFPIFLQSYGGRPWRTDGIEALHRDRLERILRDLLGRTTEQVILCHSDLAVSGQEQVGPLLPLVMAAAPTAGVAVQV
jgi:hypothetical protein